MNFNLEVLLWQFITTLPFGFIWSHYMFSNIVYLIVQLQWSLLQIEMNNTRNV